jgi:large subunit ribosomal protein L9
MKRIEKIKKAADGLRLKELQDMEALARHINGMTITLKAKVSPGGKYYGAITATQIAAEVSKLTDRRIERRLVIMEKPIEEPGEYTANLDLHPDVEASVKVVAEGEE